MADNYSKQNINTGQMIEVELSANAYLALCGLVQDSKDVNTEGICPEDGVWDELRIQFPLSDFNRAVDEGDLAYYEDAGT